MTLTGCSKTKIIRQSITPIPEDANGILYIAQEEPILVGIEGEGLVVRKNVAGYYLIHKEDLRALWDMIKKAKKEIMDNNK